ncbi:hypothetical protein [Streptomyces sp. NPDC101132]|uniref:hypothetical protein n=1 Tax=Streptomyces sp. NPDC101132 TaxID=3366110 RepID=UPI0037FF8267
MSTTRTRLTALATGVAGLTALTLTPAQAVTPPAAATETVVTCGPSGLQAGLSTRLCAEVTGTTVEFYGTVGLAGPPSPGSPAPAPKELLTTLSAQVVGSTTPPDTRYRQVVFLTAPLEVRGLGGEYPCGSTVRGTFGVASYPRSASPVAHEVTLTC